MLSSSQNLQFVLARAWCWANIHALCRAVTGPADHSAFVWGVFVPVALGASSSLFNGWRNWEAEILADLSQPQAGVCVLCCPDHRWALCACMEVLSLSPPHPLCTPDTKCCLLNEFSNWWAPQPACSSCLCGSRGCAGCWGLGAGGDPAVQALPCGILVGLRHSTELREAPYVTGGSSVPDQLLSPCAAGRLIHLLCVLRHRKKEWQRLVEGRGQRLKDWSNLGSAAASRRTVRALEALRCSALLGFELQRWKNQNSSSCNLLIPSQAAWRSLQIRVRKWSITCCRGKSFSYDCLLRAAPVLDWGSWKLELIFFRVGFIILKPSWVTVKCCVCSL